MSAYAIVDEKIIDAHFEKLTYVLTDASFQFGSKAYISPRRIR